MRQTKIAENAQVIDAKTAGELAGVSKRYIYRLCERGEIQAVRLGNVWRINRAAFCAKLGINGGECA